MKELIKKFIPKPCLSLYHKTLAVLAEQFYSHPADKLTVIGITGTKGKSTVANLVWHVLNHAELKTGMTSTANIRIGEDERMNPYKMTMPGRFEMQRLLKEMVDAGCKYAVLETTSQGIAQWRHLGINYDLVVFTNLFPEHLEAHGGWENYKAAKLKLFKFLSQKPKKNFPKTIIVNADDKEHLDFYNCKAENKIKYNLEELKDIAVTKTGLSFNLEHIHFDVPLLGEFNLRNILSAIKICEQLNIPLNDIAKALYVFKGVPGRMELINEGQDFTVLVDYAHEPKGLEGLYKFANNIKTNKIITVTGSCGGGRDKEKRAKIGELAAQYCDHVIVTNEDPYDEDPQAIIDQVAQNVPPEKLYKIFERKQGVKKALELAQPGDIVLLTAKGSEQFIMGKNNKKIPYDEREVAREFLKQ